MKFKEYDANKVSFTKKVTAKSDASTAFSNWKSFQNKLNPLRNQHRDRNGYIVCGKGGDESRDCLVIVDLDIKKINVALDKIQEVIDLPETCTLKTPSGGYHLYYFIKDKKNYHASYTHNFQYYTPKKWKDWDGIDIKADGGIVYAPGTTWSETKTEKDTIGSYDIVKDVDIAYVDVKEIENFRKYLKLISSNSNNKSKIMAAIANAETLPTGGWDDTAVDIAGYLKMAGFTLEEARMVWKENNDLVTIERDRNKDFLMNTYNKSGAVRFVRAEDHIPELKELKPKDFGTDMKGNAKTMKEISSMVIDKLNEMSIFRYDPITETVYYRDDDVWKIDYKNVRLRRQVVRLIEGMGNLGDVFDRNLTAIITKFLNTNLHIEIDMNEVVNRMFSKDDKYTIFEIPLRTKVLVIDRDKNSFVKRAYRPDDFFLFKFNADFVEETNMPLFEDFINWMFPDTMLRNYVIFGASMTLIPMYKKWNNVLYLYGNGNNGKSVLLEIISHFYPNYVTNNSRFEEICTRFGFQPIIGKWFIKGEECKPLYDNDLAHIRSMVDLATTNVDIKRRDVMEYQLTSKGFFVGNMAPILKNDGDFRRVSVIACKSIIRGAPNVNLTEEILEKEADIIFSNLLRIAVHGMENISERKSKIIDIVREQVEEAVDPLTYFCNNYVQEARGSFNEDVGETPIDLVYKLYLQVANNKNFPLFTERIVSAKVRSIFNLKGSKVRIIGKIKTRCLIGIKLNIDPLDMAALGEEHPFDEDIVEGLK